MTESELAWKTQAYSVTQLLKGAVCYGPTCFVKRQYPSIYL